MNIQQLGQVLKYLSEVLILQYVLKSSFIFSNFHLWINHVHYKTAKFHKGIHVTLSPVRYLQKASQTRLQTLNLFNDAILTEYAIKHSTGWENNHEISLDTYLLEKRQPLPFFKARSWQMLGDTEE
jgi:hypothetical protein